MQILLLVLPLVLSACSVCGKNLEIPEVSQQDLDRWVSTPEKAAEAVGCAIEHKSHCNPRVATVASLMPDLFKTNFQCRPHCSEAGQKAIDFLVKTLEDKYPEQWQRLNTHLSKGN
ncbi:unnamed protein product [Meganyctiphanes norvegica]|uniref:Chemosensory protein n=1 Tax=Meganyctiphanes norvegica TaxID=48144 RepID=A0AAV2PPU6_MEGNR